MKIALLTCKDLPNLTLSDQLLIPELAKYNHQATAVIWDDDQINWNDFDLLIFRNTWDYFEKQTQFDNWLQQIEKAKIKTLNALAVINQNKHKFYLQDLQQKGIAIIPTVFIPKTNQLDLQQIVPKHWKKAVIKPAYSAGSYLTKVFDIQDIDPINQEYQPIAAQKDLLLQEFIPEIQTEGETSFVFFDKQFSHAVNKKPVAGDFRIQSQFGGQYSLAQPTKMLIEKAQKVVDSFDEDLLYARVDGIIINNKLFLMEIECLEPDLYFSLKPGSTEVFVKAILKLID